jgi:hypothetical protein
LASPLARARVRRVRPCAFVRAHRRVARGALASVVARAAAPVIAVVVVDVTTARRAARSTLAFAHSTGPDS